MPRLFSLLYDHVMRRTERSTLGGWRAELLGDLEGEVLEIGAGTGANVAFYPRGLRRLVLTEPDRFMVPKLEATLAKVGRGDAEVVAAASEALPFPEASFDVVVSTLVLCSVPDLPRTLREIRRVLRPGGTFVYLEHVESERASARRWQHRLEPVWKHLAGGCHLTRRTSEALQEAGFAPLHETRASMHPAPSFLRRTVRGAARAPA
jgi:ubiquinone/menaquinone biosynthesis C-methylase UbiE